MPSEARKDVKREEEVKANKELSQLQSALGQVEAQGTVRKTEEE